MKIKKVNSVDHLLISSTFDYSSDFICLELERRNRKYLRINRDRFAEYKMLYSLDSDSLVIQTDNDEYCIDDTHLESVYFRAPVFIRSLKNYSLSEQLYRGQWGSFIRNLIVFNKAKWINHPVKIYRAENKLFQLKVAKEIGLDIPNTYIGNSIPDIDPKQQYIVKSLDTAIFYENGDELFTYSTTLTGDEVLHSSVQAAPIILQECIRNKEDYRVTIVGHQVFPVKVLKRGKGIEGDWRKTRKEDLQYVPAVIPQIIIDKLFKLMDTLNLKFGGVDLMFANGKYYFVEINPTGEWGWLVSTVKLPIDKAIVDCMEARCE